MKKIEYLPFDSLNNKEDSELDEISKLFIINWLQVKMNTLKNKLFLFNK